MKILNVKSSDGILNLCKAVNQRTNIKVRIIIFVLLFIGSLNITLLQEKFIEKEVSFNNGSIILEGTLILPNQFQKSPAVVFIHGSGPMTRVGFKPYAEEFAKLGVASLFYDKRGTGSSGGSWLTSSLDDLADDALAAVKYLKSREQIDPDRIGFWGISQAGWIAPIAAAKSDDIAFMILISGGGVSPRESELFSYENEFEKAGISEIEKTKARKILNAYFDFLATGKGRYKLSSLYEEAHSGVLSELVDQLERITPSEEDRSNWSWVGTYDPADDISKIKCQLLLMFGEQDKEHPTAVAVEQWKKSLQKARTEDLTLMIFPGAGHGIRMREGYTGKGRAPFADGYYEVQLGWLWLHVVNREKK